jgi:bidirectional [NiFe] hydrogenase diaphorase subunit
MSIGRSLKQRLEEAVAEVDRTDIEVMGVGCMGLCGHGPLVRVDPEGTLYEHVRAADAPSIVAALDGGEATAPRGNPQHPFFALQKRIVLENSGIIDPERIESYIAAGGYQALYHALHEMTPAEVIDIVTRSGLRGRGGAGYPTGLKWATVAKSHGDRKYVVCNADEGDPGAFMDRSIIESDPHKVLEGMAIAAYAVGADQGYVYVRAEYPLAIQRLQRAIVQARRHGLLGAQIFDSGFTFRVDIRVGAGAFVCGEETALMASIEGRRGQPRPRPPYPAESGLWGRPTLINNVETFANIPPIIRNGAEWFAAIGAETSKGTKVFALTGKIRHTGLIEVPMGVTLRQIVEEMGGGVPDGRVKAVQTGGPSGGCIPADPARYAGRLRIAPAGWFDYGVGWHGGDGRRHQHGGCGALLHGVLQRRIMRQVYSVSGWYGANVAHARSHSCRAGDCSRPRATRATLCDGEGNQSVRSRSVCTESGSEHDEVFPPGI